MALSETEIIAALSQLPERQFIETIYAALSLRNEDQSFPDGGFQYDRWCLVQTSFGRFNGNTDEEVYIELVAQVAPEFEHVNWTNSNEQGRCKNCGALIVSVAKTAVCPACSNAVSCT